jgi:hypothetical protein
MLVSSSRLFCVERAEAANLLSLLGATPFREHKLSFVPWATVNVIVSTTARAASASIS